MSVLLVALCLIALLTILFVGLTSFALLLAFFGPAAAFAFMATVQVSRWGFDAATSLGVGILAFLVGVLLMRWLVRALYRGATGLISLVRA